MKKASEIFETPEASGFDRVTPNRRVEEIVEEWIESKNWEAVFSPRIRDEVKDELLIMVGKILAKHHQDLMSEFETKLNEVVQVVSDDEFHINPTKMTELLAFIKSK